MINVINGIATEVGKLRKRWSPHRTSRNQSEARCTAQIASAGLPRSDG